MKSLSLQRPLVMLVIGAPGSGKSFFARQFSDMFGAPLVSFDQLQFRLFTEPTHNLEEEAIISDVMKIQIAELAKTQKLLIVDGGVNSRVKRHELQRIVKNHDYNSLIIWVQTDELTAKKRAMRRDRRRSGDIFNHSISEQQFISLAKRFTPPHANEKVIVVSGKHTFSSQARAVLKRLAPARDSRPINPVKRQAPDSNPTSPSPKPQSPQRRNIILS